MRLAVARLTVGPRSALDMHTMAIIGVRTVAAIGVHDYACDGASAPPEW
jgi:hypothetical protein